jgi:tetratricopeptide (TPR) repeat protein
MKPALKAIALLAASAVLATAQKPKSQKEVDALMAVQQATTPDARIAAVEALISKFADTEFKSWAFNVAAEAAQAKRDNAKSVFYYEQGIKADPKNHMAMLMIAAVIAQNTRDTDLDKEEKLARAEKYAKDGMALVPSASKPNPQITDAQWEGIKKDDLAQGHVDLGIIANVRKKPDVAVAEFKTAVDSAATPDPIVMIRLASALNDAGKPDEALAVLDKALATPELNPQIKSVADSEKARSQKLKTAK